MSKIMDHIRRKNEFYKRFATEAEWAEWLTSAEGTFELLTDPWKRELPQQFKVVPPASEILEMIRNRKCD